jgi:hypothetical protein
MGNSTAENPCPQLAQDNTCGHTELNMSNMIKVYQLLAHGRWFSPGTPASSTTKTGRHDIVESGVKQNQSNQINQSINYVDTSFTDQDGIILMKSPP